MYYYRIIWYALGVKWVQYYIIKEIEMYKSEIIEESLNDKNCLNSIKPYFVSTRIQEINGDEYPIWHTNKYLIPGNKTDEILNVLKDNIKTTWYIHLYNNENLYVILYKKYFKLPVKKDNSWNEMIEYGTKIGLVEKFYLEDIPMDL